MRRLHVSQIAAGAVALDRAQVHHARDVLRLRKGDHIELFDDAGHTAVATISRIDGQGVILDVQQVNAAGEPRFEWIVASAVPKGSRGDWMIEKLSELGAAAFVPLSTDRSVVVPEGTGKRQRWQRLAAEAARQSHRTGVMRIEEIAGIEELLRRIGGGCGWYFSTQPPRLTVQQAIARVTRHTRALYLLVGPEGGWTQRELESFSAAGLTAVGLGETILRVETAALAAAVLAATVIAPALARPDEDEP